MEPEDIYTPEQLKLFARTYGLTNYFASSQHMMAMQKAYQDEAEAMRPQEQDGYIEVSYREITPQKPNK